MKTRANTKHLQRKPIAESEPQPQPRPQPNSAKDASSIDNDDDDTGTDDPQQPQPHERRRSIADEAEQLQIIRFVRDNEVLYRTKHKYYRNKPLKDKLWLVLAAQMNRDVAHVRSKWHSMRDYFIRSLKDQNQSRRLTQRDHELWYLLDKAHTEPTHSTKPDVQALAAQVRPDEARLTLAQALQAHSTTAGTEHRRLYSRWPIEEEAQLVRFVRANAMLYSVHHRRYRERAAKQRLWAQLATQMNRNVHQVKAKWITLRDYIVRTVKATNKPAPTNEREELLWFLVDDSGPTKLTRTRAAEEPKRPQVGDSKSRPGVDDSLTSGQEKPQQQQNDNSLAVSHDIMDVDADLDTRSGGCQQPQEQQQQQHHQSVDDIAESNRLLRAILERSRAAHMERTAAEDRVNCHVRAFLRAMAQSVCRMPPEQIARLKIAISRVVGEAELASLQQQQQQTTAQTKR